MPRRDGTIRLTFTVELADGEGSHLILEDIAAAAKVEAQAILKINERQAVNITDKIGEVNPIHEKLEVEFQKIRKLADEYAP